MKIADAHCDLLSAADGLGGFKNSCLSISEMLGYDSYVQFLACFISPRFYNDAKRRFCVLKNRYFDMINKNARSLMHCESFDDAAAAEKLNKIACFITVEGGECIECAEDISKMRRVGVRVLGPVWDRENRIASERGLTPFGKEIILKMNELGIYTDVSHMKDRAFYDVCSLSEKPVFATHSNSRAVCAAGRNLTDAQIGEIIRRGGFIGINLYPLFLSGNVNADIDDILRHVEHILSLGGENNLGLGCDFDGIDFMPEGISGAGDLYKIFNRLSLVGYSDRLIQKISYENLKEALRLF